MGFDHDSMNIHYSSIHHVLDDDYDEEVMEDHTHRHLSRLSRCTSNSKSSPPTDDEEDELELGMSALSMDDGEDADTELSDKGEVGSSALSSDSDSKGPRCYSLPATPPRRRARRHGGGFPNLNQSWILKEYASENDAQLNKGTMRKSNQSHSRRQRSSSSSSISFRERWIKTAWWGNKKKFQGSAMDEEGEIVDDSNNNNNNSGESESLVITSRPKGGKKSLCMDLEEVKACKDLGFDLEHEMVELPGRISMPCSTNENSSGGNSPNANWRISNPGDDPRDVKARLKVWAQAVAIASTSRAPCNQLTS